MENKYYDFKCKNCGKYFKANRNTRKCFRCGHEYSEETINQIINEREDYIANSSWGKATRTLENAGRGIEEAGKGMTQIGCALTVVGIIFLLFFLLLLM